VFGGHGVLQKPKNDLKSIQIILCAAGGSWIQISTDAGFFHLAQVHVEALGTTSNGMTFIYTHAFDRTIVLHDDPIDDSQFAWERELLEELSMEERTFDLDKVHSLTLLMAFLFDGKRRFVEYNH